MTKTSQDLCSGSERERNNEEEKEEDDEDPEGPGSTKAVRTKHRRDEVAWCGGRQEDPGQDPRPESRRSNLPQHAIHEDISLSNPLQWPRSPGLPAHVLAAPRHATPRHATPRHATPRHATPRPVTLLITLSKSSSCPGQRGARRLAGASSLCSAT
jgi:hypothetical protein